VYKKWLRDRRATDFKRQARDLPMQPQALVLKTASKAINLTVHSAQRPKSVEIPYSVDREDFVYCYQGVELDCSEH
jgi:hypothetical protein